ncbi:MAG: ATP-binding cassette domain-containing protein [Candidatus Latescibacteria bacterium]|jgi:phospholipid/cholesterol/gamma-HCH transport system ATP-binding protein|nr:ATP-binding cassette domain-containing protein [Candidatus Latescibacterota bacterium]
MSDDIILEVENLHAWYGRKHVLEGINLTVEAGSIMVVLGTSGCGKSTLLKNIIRLYTPGKGSINLLGNEMTELEEEDVETVLRQVGVMYQNGALLNSLTIGENVALPLEIHTDMSPKLRREIAETKLRQVELLDVYDRYPRELSGGMQKRVAVARAIVMDPDIIFCDEPSAGLDPVTAQGLDRLLISLNETLGMTIVVVTHELESIKRIAHYITYLDNGKVLFTGTIEEAFQADIPQIQEFFLRDNV